MNTIPFPVKFDLQGHCCNVYVSSRPTTDMWPVNAYVSARVCVLVRPCGFNYIGKSFRRMVRRLAGGWAVSSSSFLWCAQRCRVFRASHPNAYLIAWRSDDGLSPHGCMCVWVCVFACVCVIRREHHLHQRAPAATPNQFCPVCMHLGFGIKQLYV